MLLLLSMACIPALNPAEGGSPFDASVSKGVDSGTVYSAAVEMAKLARGEPADIDGDGVPDTFTESLPDGSVKIVSSSTGTPDMVVLRFVNGDEQTDLFDGTGLLRSRDTYEAAPRRRVTLKDTDGDGVFDERRTMTWPLVGVQHVTRETFSVATATWVTTTEDDFSDEVEQGPRCTAGSAPPRSP
jgi:hypothetical protein